MRNTLICLLIVTVIQLTVKTKSTLISTQLKTVRETANQVEISQGSSKKLFKHVVL